MSITVLKWTLYGGLAATLASVIFGNSFWLTMGLFAGALSTLFITPMTKLEDKR